MILLTDIYDGKAVALVEGNLSAEEVQELIISVKVNDPCGYDMEDLREALEENGCSITWFNDMEYVEW